MMVKLTEKEMEKKLKVLEKELKEYKDMIPRLEDSEKKLKLLLDTMPEQFALYDKDFKIIFTNKYSQEIGTRIGRTMYEKLNGRHCYEVWHNRDKLCDNCPVKKAMDTGEVQQGEVITPDGRTHLIHGIALFDELGNVTGLAEYSKDITERKLLEKQLLQSQKMEAIGVLAGGIAHDFNNLLTVINGYSELALIEIEKAGLSSKGLYKTIETILKSGEKAENLTGQLLAFSRKQVYKAEILEVNSIISSMEKMLKRLIGEDININISLTDELPRIKADTSQIDQILINLIVNARDAVYAVSKSDYKRQITVETGSVNLDDNFILRHRGSSKGKHVFISVSDNGIGMDEITQQKIFEPFFTTKDKFKGTGLGLATVYGIVKQNNGSIYVYSEENKGTTFKIYWPAVEEDEVSAVTLDSKVISNEKGNENILVVEDDDDVCDFATEALSNLGYNVFHASNGRIALDIIKNTKTKFDLIITDLVMPELGGVEFAEKARKIISGVKIIYVSGYTDNHIVNNGMLEDGINFIQKPYSVKKLSSYIRQVFDNN